LQFNFAVSDEIKFLLLTNLNLISNKAQKMKFIFQNVHEINRFSVCNLKSFETMKVQLLKVADFPASITSLQEF